MNKLEVIEKFWRAAAQSISDLGCESYNYNNEPFIRIDFITSRLDLNTVAITNIFNISLHNNDCYFIAMTLFDEIEEHLKITFEHKSVQFWGFSKVDSKIFFPEGKDLKYEADLMLQLSKIPL